MKLTKQLLSDLTMLSKISHSITFDPKSDFVHVRDDTKTIYAKYIVSAEELGISELNDEVGIYDLPSLVSLLNLMTDPELIFSDEFVELSDETSTSKFYYSDLSVIAKPDNEMPVSDDDFDFIISAETVSKIQKASGTLNLDEIIFSDKSITLRSNNNSTGNEFSVMQTSDASKEFEVVLAMNEFSLLSGNYGVTINKNYIDFNRGGINILIATVA